MLICEEMFLLGTKPSGKLVRHSSSGTRAKARSVSVKVAAIAELILIGRVKLTREYKPRPGRKSQTYLESLQLYVIDASPTGDAILDDVLRVLANASGTEASQFFGGSLDSQYKTVSLKPHKAVADRLVKTGILRARRGGFLGLRRLYRTVNPEPRRQAHARVSALLRGRTELPPTPRDCTLLFVMMLMNTAKWAFREEYTSMGRKAFRARYSEIMNDERLGPEFKEYLDDLYLLTVKSLSEVSQSGPGYYLSPFGLFS